MEPIIYQPEPDVVNKNDEFKNFIEIANKKNILPNKNKNFRICSFNVHSFKNYNNVEINFDKFKTVINELDCDILCLQEVIKDSQFYNFLLQKYKFNIYCDADYDGFGNAILSNIKLDVIFINTYRSKTFYSSKKQRCVICCKCVYNQTELNIVNLHLETQEFNKRLNILNNIMKNIIKLPNPILVGDFNDTSIGQYLKLKMFENTYLPHTYPEMTSKYNKTIDYIFYHKCSDIQIINSGIFYTDISDHFPVYTDLTIINNTSIDCKRKKPDEPIYNWHITRYQPAKEIFKIKITNRITNKPEKILNIQFNNSSPFQMNTNTDNPNIRMFEVINEQFSNLNFKIIKINKGYKLYKGVKKATMNMDNDDISNMYAKKPSWYSTKEIAYYYLNSEDYAVNEYELIRDIKLFYLMDNDNIKNLLKLIYDKLRNKINEIMNTRPITYQINDICKTLDLSRVDCKLKEKCGMNIIQAIIDNNCLNQVIDYIINKYWHLDITQEIYTLREYIKILYMSTGYDITWEEQYSMIANWLHEERPRNKSETDHYETDNNTIIYQINNSLHSHKKEHLNRVSLTLNTDTIMINAICDIINLDGYISHTVPSLWHSYGTFPEELALINSRGALKKTTFKFIPSDLTDMDYPYSNLVFKMNINSNI